jgi:hypothetical protein
MMSDIVKRLPFAAYPKGWFQVAYHSGNAYVVRHRGLGLWQSKIYRDRPQLARGEGAITEFRVWARRSYEEAPT